MKEEKMKIVDLFAGCGGLGSGFRAGGFDVPFAVELDLWASETYQRNHPETKVLNKDIREIKYIENKNGKPLIFDGLIGGPPCQGFSLSGKRDKKDPRNSLFMEFKRILGEHKPLFFVMENVPGLLSMKNQKNQLVKDIIIDAFEKEGYDVKYKILDASQFGVPQKRKRVFFVGFRSDLEMKEYAFFPELENNVEIVSIKDALSDLPPIPSAEGKEFFEYGTPPKNKFQEEMRTNSEGFYNHVAMKHTERIIERFKTIKQGQSLADVSKEHSQRKRGEPSKISGKTYAQNNRRPLENKPSPTIAASFQGNFVHPWINRNFTAREAARLQSFPDKYIFYGKRTTMSWEKNLSQYQQIGNAVPPLLAKNIAKHLNAILRKNQDNA